MRRLGRKVILASHTVGYFAHMPIRPGKKSVQKAKAGAAVRGRGKQERRGEGSPNVNPKISGVGSVQSRIWRCRAGGEPARESDNLAREEPLEIRLLGRGVAVTMRTPGHDDELAAGFLLGEGVVRQRQDIVEIAYCQRGEAASHENTLNVFVAPSVGVRFEKLTRHGFVSSSCGVCGKASIESVHQHFEPVKSQVTVRQETILALPQKLLAAQKTFARTGGLHAAAIFEPDGTLVALREDVGRHNAVDKVIGFGFLAGLLPYNERVLLVSGRASFEILQKSLAARIPVVCAVSAPSSLAVEFAEASGQTLIGFLRGDTMNIYSHPERILGAKSQKGRERKEGKRP